MLVNPVLFIVGNVCQWLDWFDLYLSHVFVGSMNTDLLSLF